MSKLARARVGIVLGSGLVVGSIVWLIVSPGAVPAVCLGLGAVVLVISVMRRLERLTLHEMDLPNTPLRVGEPFSISYGQQFRRATDVAGIRFALVMRETAKHEESSSTGDGTTTVTDTGERVAQEFTVAGQRYQPGQTINETCAFQIPVDGMHTFYADNNKIEWYIVARVEIPGWPDYVSEEELAVLPELAE
jgi:hypothetical protein